ncbi:3-ketoacyl-CoA thiolase, peroxisomal [Hondaea fermentalgiana]|uniref:acetyl-CoA C-acyltransferase n=1 Tax=Hondaea fermentalgiana TaxID=2315210 RepID=A0A2R5GAK4_9STRA|nr:3-ketoacyl-CoA thiolase, peroxisomal [Hondaea fermentalgiana]|eukprot:GBG28030.1 3-ketoacyl-CoA thiolase, peroxisomal [Hondaea fermentalgiana]
MANRLEKLAAHLQVAGSANGAGVDAQLTSMEQKKIFGAVGSQSDDDVVIVSAKRTAIARARKGGFKDTTPDTLLKNAFEGVLADSKLDPKEIQDIVVGNVQMSGAYSMPGRAAAVLAGIPESAGFVAMNRQCSSGLEAVATIASKIKSGVIEVGIGAGVESMSNGGSPGDVSNMPPMDLNSIFQHPVASQALTPMGITSENVAAKFGITREEQDQMAVDSHAKALKAQEQGWLKDEIIPVTVTVEDADGNEKEVVIDKDEGPRAGTTMEKLAKLKPAFKEGGSTTAGNASQVSDGAAAVILMSRRKAKELGMPIKAVFRGYKVVGVPAAIMGIGPAAAIPACLESTGVSVSDVDVYEINEAFASQATYCVKKLGIPMNKVNPVGSGISLGHPLGCTGARQVATLLNTFKREHKKLGVVSMCIGTGMGAAALIENEQQ